MPFMDGLELSRLVKKALPHTKIILLSGYNEFEYAKEAIKIGISEYLLKPITSASLTEALKKTFINRNDTFSVAQFEQIIAFDGDDAMQKKWRAFCRKTDIKTDDYSMVLQTIKVFLEKPFTAAVEGGLCTEKWSASTGRWYLECAELDENPS